MHASDSEQARVRANAVCVHTPALCRQGCVCCARGHVYSEVAHGHHREEAAKTLEKAWMRPLERPGSGPEGVRGAAAGGKCEADAAIALLKEPGLAVPSYRPCNPVSQQSPFRKSFISL